MKVEISNWGPIEKCEFDLQKNLSVIYGDNNIGKSYAMQVLYLLLKKLLEYTSERSRYFGYYRYYSNNPIILQMLSEFVTDEQVGEKNITERIIKLYAVRLAQEWLPDLISSLENTFGAFSRILEENPCIRMQDMDNWSLVIYPQEQKIDFHIKTKPVYLKKTTSDFHKSREYKNQFDIYVYHNKIETPMQLVEERGQYIRKRFALEIEKIANYVYFLPASRSGIHIGMNSLGPILAQLSQNRASIRGSFQIPSIPEPISDYYVKLSTIRGDGYEHFRELASEIEAKILKGEVLFDNKKKTLTYKEESTGHSFEMSDVSSMVSEIAPITAYLKYIVNKGRRVLTRQGMLREKVSFTSVIFIEEPEAHLHPKNQVALLKIFVQLAKMNVKLVIASHSNYVFNALNNLILGKELDIDMYAPMLMRRERTKSFTKYMKADELGISDENFTDVAEMLYEEREELIQKIIQEEETERE